MSGIRRIPGRSWLAERVRRRYVRRAARKTGSERFASLGEQSIVHPPAVIINPQLVSVGAHTTVAPGAFISVVEQIDGKRYDARLTIGDHVQIGFDIVIACAGLVEIGDHVLTADRIFIGDTYHEYRRVPEPVIDQGLHDPEPVSIGRGAFLGIGCAILPGVTVGEGAYVGANAVVSKDVPSFSVVAGNPAKVVRRWDGSAWVDVA